VSSSIIIDAAADARAPGERARTESTLSLELSDATIRHEPDVLATTLKAGAVATPSELVTDVLALANPKPDEHAEAVQYTVVPTTGLLFSLRTVTLGSVASEVAADASLRMNWLEGARKWEDDPAVTVSVRDNVTLGSDVSEAVMVYVPTTSGVGMPAPEIRPDPSLVSVAVIGLLALDVTTN
jgi:hypothetical protein